LGQNGAAKMKSLFGKLYEDKYYINVCRSFSQHQANDLLHDAIIKIYDAKPNIETEAQLKSYFYKVVKSLFLQQKKDQTIELINLNIEDKQEQHYDVYKLLEVAPINNDDFVVKEITKLYLSLGSYKKVSDKLNIPQRTICHMVNKFIQDARSKIDN
jgi:DNA-directed RNA polymerase specialized sigma24 family protein